MKFTEKLLWITVSIIVIILLLYWVIYNLQHQGYHLLLEFKMDNNTLEAVKAINWSAIPQ